MADNVRFHSKFHSKVHHTERTAGYNSSAEDPIAGPNDPFAGNFYANASIFAGYGTGVGTVSAPTLKSDNLVVGSNTFTASEFGSYVRVPLGATPLFGQHINVGDPYWDKVVLYTAFEGTHSSTSVTGSGNTSVNMGVAGTNVYLTSADAKFGSSSLYLDGTGTFNISGAIYPLRDAKSWTIEFWAKPKVGSTGDINLFSIIPRLQAADTCLGNTKLGLLADLDYQSNNNFVGAVYHIKNDCASADSSCTSYDCCTLSGGNTITPLLTARNQVGSGSCFYFDPPVGGHSYGYWLTGGHTFERCSTHFSWTPYVSGTDHAFIVSNSGTRLDVNAWNHIAISDDGSKGRLFINGKNVGQFKTTISCNAPTTTTAFASGDELVIGGDRPWGQSTAVSNPFIGWIDELRITKDVSRYGANFVPAERALPTVSYLTPSSTQTQQSSVSIVSQTYGPELQYKVLIPGDNVSLYASESAIQINANVPGIPGAMASSTASLPVSGTPVTVVHGLSGSPEVLRVTMETIPQVYPGSAVLPYLQGEEVDIQAFQRAGNVTSAALSSMRWDELYTVTAGPSSVIVTRNIDDNNSTTSTTSADELLSFITKDGDRHFVTNEAELSASFRLKVTAVKGSINYNAALDQSIRLYPDGTDNSLSEQTVTSGGNTNKYWRVRSQGIKSHHIDDKQIKTWHIADNQITTRTLENISTIVAGTYSHPQLTVDSTGRVTSIQSQTVTNATGGGITKDDVYVPSDVYFNAPGSEPTDDPRTCRIAPSGTFGNWVSAYDVLSHHTPISGVGSYDPYVVKLPSGKKRVRIKCWGGGAGSNLTTTSSSFSAYHGGAGGYAEATYIMDHNVTELVVWIGSGGASMDWGKDGTTGTATATGRPIQLSSIIFDQDPINNLWFDQMHPPGCGGNTFVTVNGVSGHPVTIVKAYGGGVRYNTSTNFASLSAGSEKYETTAAMGGGLSNTQVTKTATIVQDASGNSVSGACTFFTDPFDPGIPTGWTAGNNSLSALEHVIGIDAPSTANTLSAAHFNLYYEDFSTSSVLLTAYNSHYVPFYTFSSPGENGRGVYTDVNICDAPPCWIVLPDTPAISFGSNNQGYGTGGRVLDRYVGSNWDFEDGRDGGCIVEIL